MLQRMAVLGLSRPSTLVFTSQPMSQWAPKYLDPLPRKEDQKAAQESGEILKYLHAPIKAALTNQTSSVFYDHRVAKMCNYIMKAGNKKLARELLEKAFENIKRVQLERYNLAETEEEKAKIITDPVKIFHQAIENCRPLLQLTPIKRGGVTYQVPVPITEKRSYFEAMRWLKLAAQTKERTVHFPEKFAWEVLDAAAGKGRVVKQKQDLHQQCEANRAYAHYRWS